MPQRKTSGDTNPVCPVSLLAKKAVRKCSSCCLSCGTCHRGPSQWIQPEANLFGPQNTDYCSGTFYLNVSLDYWLSSLCSWKQDPQPVSCCREGCPTPIRLAWTSVQLWITNLRTWDTPLPCGDSLCVLQSLYPHNKSAPSLIYFYIWNTILLGELLNYQIRVLKPGIREGVSPSHKCLLLEGNQLHTYSI